MKFLIKTDRPSNPYWFVQKLWLKNFEFHINPATWNAAQDLLQAGGIKSLREIEKHFWVALVEDGAVNFEVEAIITPHKIKAFTCECWTEGRRLICPHIAAALFKVRQFLDQKAEARLNRLEAKKSEELGRLTVQTVLEQAQPDDLAEFVREYARNDRDFGLALKTWFAGQLSGAENPFLLLLDAAMPRLAGSRPLREPELRRLRKTLDHLDTQVAGAASEGNARGVFQITTAVLQKMAPLLPKMQEIHREQLVHYCQKALQKLVQLPIEQLSPELQEQRQNTLFEFAAKGLAQPELDRALLQFLGQAATDDHLFAKIRSNFDETPAPASPLVLHLFLVALARRSMPEAVPRVLEDYSQLPARVKDAIVTLYYLHYWQAVLLSGEYFLAKNLFNAGQRREIEDLMLLSAEKTGDRTRQMRYLRERYGQTGQIELFQRLKTLAGDKWPAARKKLLAELQTKGNTERLAPVLAAEGDLDALAALLEARPELGILQEYENLFLPHRKNFVRDRYVTLLSGYLTDHFGRQASGYAREQLAGLLRKGQTELVLEIIRALTVQFTDRHTLPEELAELFPKSKRHAMLPSQPH